MSTPSPVTPIRVLIVEDHELARFGLSMALSEHPSFTVLGEAENGRQGVELARSKQPDVVLMDIGMPVMDGIQATQAIKQTNPGIRIIMLTSISQNEEVLAALSAGADAYCMKDIRLDRLHQVIEMVMDGSLWLDPAVARVVMQALPRTQTESTPGDSAANPATANRRRYNTELTERELEVLRLIVAGKSNKEIAQTLNITNHTAKAHVGNIIQKLSVDDRTQVAVKALRDGLIGPSDVSVG